MAGGRIKGITIEIDGDTKGLNSALKDVNSQTAKTSTELRDVNKLLKLDPGNTELIAQKQELLGKAVESTSEKLSTLKSAQAQVESQFKSGDIGVEQYRSFQREIIATESQLQRFEEGAKGVDDALNGIDSAAGKAESGFKNIHNSADDADNSLSFTKGAAAGNLLSGLSDKSKDLGGTLISTGLSFQDSQSKIQAALGLTDGQAKNAMDSVHGVFDSGLVDSADEATQAVIATKNSFQNLDGIQLTNMTNSLLQISQVTGNDIEDTANAASQAMKGFGISGDEATDVVAKGLQMGLDKNHDFLDTMNEYSPTFKDAGLNAQQMLSVMNAGMKNGSFNTDKAADAVKEFNLRLTSGQLDEPMKKFSMATQDVFQQFKNGQATSADVMASVGNDLKGMPADQAKAAVQGLGTQFEDMGQKSSAALLMATDGVVKTDGAAKSMNKDSPGKDWQSAINSLKDSFSSLLEVFTPVIKMLADVMKGIAGLGQPMKTVIGLIGGAIVALGALAPVMLTLKTSIDVFNGMSAAVKKFAEITKLASAATKVWSAIQVVFNAIMALNPLTLFIIAIAAVIAIIAIVITKMHAWGEIADWLKDVWNGIKDFFAGLWDGIKQVFTSAVQGIGQFLQSGFGQAIMFIINPFAGLINFFVQNWDQIKQIFTSVVDAIGSFLSGAWNGISSTAQGVFNGISSFISGIWNGISGFTSGVWNGISSTISSVWNGIQSGVSSAVNAVSSVISNIWNGIKSATSSVWNGIKDAITGPMDAAKNMISGIINAIKGFFSFSITWPHIPLPHFSINPSGWQIGDLLKGKIPSLGINWHAKGGIFNKPTLFAGQGGMHGVGEAGPEAVMPLNAKTLAGIGAGIAANMDNLGQPQININVYADVTDSTIKKIGREVQSAMARTARNKNVAMGGI